MMNAGFTEKEAKAIVEVTIYQQKAYGFNEKGKVIRVPNRINTVKTKSGGDGS